MELICLTCTKHTPCSLLCDAAFSCTLISFLPPSWAVTVALESIARSTKRLLTARATATPTSHPPPSQPVDQSASLAPPTDAAVLWPGSQDVLCASAGRGCARLSGQQAALCSRRRRRWRARAKPLPYCAGGCLVAGVQPLRRSAPRVLPAASGALTCRLAALVGCSACNQACTSSACVNGLLRSGGR